MNPEILLRVQTGHHLEIRAKRLGSIVQTIELRLLQLMLQGTLLLIPNAVPKNHTPKSDCVAAHCLGYPRGEGPEQGTRERSFLK
jgi:hypothetical protein